MKNKSLEYGGKLALVCVVAMAGVAGAWVKARSSIEAGKEAAFNTAIREVLGLEPGDPDPTVLNPDAPREERVFFASVDGEKRYAGEGAQQGFSSRVTVAVGARLENGEPVIRAVRVISQSETPGLGTRIAEQETNLTLWSKIGNMLGAETKEKTDWFFLKRFRGKGLPNLVVTGDAAEADSKVLKITGVTISTNATVAAARKAMTKIVAEIPKRD